MSEKFKKPSEDNLEDIIEYYSKIMNKTKEIMEFWKSYGPENAPTQASKELIKVMYDWQISLTDSLKRWIEIEKSITIGDLILARANIGIIVENWLKFFMTVYADVFYSEKKISINDLCFKDLIKGFTNVTNPKIIHKKLSEFDHYLSKEQLANELKRRKEEVKYFSSIVRWLNIVRNKRNAVHSFNYTDLGSPNDSLEDLRTLDSFIDFIIARLPNLDSPTVD